MECANYGNHDSRELRCQSAQLDLLKIFCSLVSLTAYRQSNGSLNFNIAIQSVQLSKVSNSSVFRCHLNTKDFGCTL